MILGLPLYFAVANKNYVTVPYFDASLLPTAQIREGKVKSINAKTAGDLMKVRCMPTSTS